MKFPAQLRQLLKQHDMTVSQLGRAVKISPKTIYSWLNGQSPRNISQVKSLANYFSISLDELLFGEVPKTKVTFEDYRDEINAGTFVVILRRTRK